MLPTIVLVHGAFAESASWGGVVDPLLAAGHDVIAAPNPLRGLAADAQAVSDLVRTVDGPVVLVAHSYGGAVITNVDADAGDIVGLVYVNGFAPERGETCFALAGKFPGSMLGETTRTGLAELVSLEATLNRDREQIWRELTEFHKPLSIGAVEEKLDTMQGGCLAIVPASFRTSRGSTAC